MLQIDQIRAEELNCRNKEQQTGSEGRLKEPFFGGCCLYQPDDDGLCVTRLFRDGHQEMVLASHLGRPPGTDGRGKAQGMFWDAKFPDYPTLPSKSSSKKNQPPSVCPFFPLSYPRRSSLGQGAMAARHMVVPNPEAVVQACDRRSAASLDIVSVAKRALTDNPSHTEKGLFVIDHILWYPSTDVFQVARNGRARSPESQQKKPEWRRSPKRQKKGRTEPKKREPTRVSDGKPGGCHGLSKKPGHVPPISFYRCGVVVKQGPQDTNPRVHWPAVDFPLRRDYVSQHRGDSREVLSLEWRGERYFRSKESAKEVACWSILLCFPEFFSSRTKLDQLIWDTQNSQAEDGEDAEDESYSVGLAAKEKRHISSFAAIHTSRDRRSKQCSAVITVYRRGGLAVFLVNETGHRISGIYLRIPNHVAKRTCPGPTWGGLGQLLVKHECLGMTGHRQIKGCVEVHVRWWDRSTTWEPLRSFSKDAHWDCCQHARREGLLEQKGWRFLNRGRKHGIPREKLTVGDPDWADHRSPQVHNRASMNFEGHLTYHGSAWMCSTALTKQLVDQLLLVA